MSKIRIVIVEDELNNADYIAALLQNTAVSYELMGIARSVSDAIKLIDTTEPDLVLLDVVILEGTGFDVLDRISHRDFQVIFITAYEQYAIKALKKRAFDYLLKPIVRSEFHKAIINCAAAINEEEPEETPNDTSDQTLLIRSHSGNVVLPMKYIIFFHAQSNYTLCITTERTYMISKNLSIVSKSVPEEMFFRCHKSYLVNLNHIEYADISKDLIHCSRNHAIPLSQRKRHEFMQKARHLS